MMLSNDSSTLWKADPHTIAKIRILEEYLVAWFQILGRTRPGQDLTYIDGFAGPGKYTNSNKGSPIAALAAAKIALSQSGGSWKAGKIVCCFIEETLGRAEVLRTQIEPFQSENQITIVLYKESFTQGLKHLRDEYPRLFIPQWPMFAFIDPCGATGVPLNDILALLKNPTGEVLLNFDADGVGRIYKAGKGANHESILDEIYSDRSWENRFKKIHRFDSLCREALGLYIDKLKSAERVKYVFPFEMRTRANRINYFLLFASQHRLGLEKMKEAMKSVDQDGEFCFSDARIGQESLFRFDDPEKYAQQMLQFFAGSSVSYSDTHDFALLHTPFSNPKAMLKELEVSSYIEVSNSGQRRRGTFNEAKITSIQFKKLNPRGEQV